MFLGYVIQTMQPFSRSVEMSIQVCFSHQSWRYRLGMIQEFIEKTVQGCRFLLIISLSGRKKLWLDGYERENYNFAVIL